MGISNISINLVSGTTSIPIASNILASLGGFPFTPSVSIPLGNYNIQISDNDDGNTALKFSTPVIIVAPTIITVTSPNGGETWKVGETHNVTWTSNGLNNVSIGLKGGIASPTKILATVPASSGSYSWKIDSTIQSGSQYKILIYDPTNPSSQDISDNYFTISATSCTPYWQCTAWGVCANNIQTRTCTDINNCGVTTGKPATAQVCTLQPTLTITSPISGSKLVQNQKYNIAWTYSGINNISINLVGNISPTGIIGTSIPIVANFPTTFGIFPFTPTTAIPPGNYNIQISDIDPGHTSLKFSTPITIVTSLVPAASVVSPSSSLTVVSPNGGETWVAGQTQTIKWTSYAPGPATIVLTDNNRPNVDASWSVSDPVLTNGVYSYQVSTTSSLTPGDSYKITVTQGPATDSSDKYFSITAQNELASLLFAIQRIVNQLKVSLVK